MGYNTGGLDGILGGRTEEAVRNYQSSRGLGVDEIAGFLDGYRYSSYDEILNIADLMATSEGIVSPAKRIEDIRSRKPADSKNEGYFLTEFTNKLLEFLEKMGGKAELPKVNSKMDERALREMFYTVSEIFYREYQDREKYIR